MTKLGICCFASSCHFSLVGVETWIQITLMGQRICMERGWRLGSRLPDSTRLLWLCHCPSACRTRHWVPHACTQTWSALESQRNMFVVHTQRSCSSGYFPVTCQVTLALSLLLQLMQIQVAFVEEKSALGNRFAGPLKQTVDILTHCFKRTSSSWLVHQRLAPFASSEFL